MKLNDALIGALLLILSGAVLVTIQSYPRIPGQNIGPGAFPGLLAILLAVCGALLVWKGLREKPRAGWFVVSPWVGSPHHVLNFTLTVVSLLFCVLLFDKLGFILCAVAVLVTLFWTLGVRRGLILPVALAIALGVHSIFYFGLRVPLPWGVLQPIAW